MLLSQFEYVLDVSLSHAVAPRRSSEVAVPHVAGPISCLRAVIIRSLALDLCRRGTPAGVDYAHVTSSAGG